MATSDQLVFLDGTRTPVDGHMLSFGSNILYVINIGDIGAGSAGEVATAADQAYVVADTNGIAVTAVRGGTGGIFPGEHAIFMGQTEGGQVEYWFWGSLANAANGSVPVALLFHSADTNGNHLVDPSELTQIPTLLSAIPAGPDGGLG